jgi:hypothetical protein
MVVNAVSGAVEGTLGGMMGFLGFGGPPDPRSNIGKAKYGEIYAERAAAHAQGAAKSGRVQQGLAKKAQGLGEGYLTDFAENRLGAAADWSPTQFLERLLKGRGPTYDTREINTTSWRHTGGDSGPGFFLQQFQGSNRGSGNYVAQVPRYSVQETRTSINKYDKQNFMALGKHPGKKYLEAGTEQMFQKKPMTTTLGGARQVTRRFL